MALFNEHARPSGGRRDDPPAVPACGNPGNRRRAGSTSMWSRRLDGPCANCKGTGGVTRSAPRAPEVQCRRRALGHGPGPAESCDYITQRRALERESMMMAARLHPVPLSHDHDIHRKAAGTIRAGARRSFTHVPVVLVASAQGLFTRARTQQGDRALIEADLDAELTTEQRMASRS